MRGKWPRSSATAASRAIGPARSGPFSLLTYDDARRHAAMIREVVDDRRMPPVARRPPVRSLPQRSQAFAQGAGDPAGLVDQRAPLGEPTEIPASKSFPEEWTVGTPDVVFEIPEPYVVAAQGVLDYVKVRSSHPLHRRQVGSGGRGDAGDRSVVHHIIVYVDDHAKDSGRERDAHLPVGSPPGDMLPSVFPPGTAKKIPAGSTTSCFNSTTPNGKARIDRSKVGLTFAKTPVEHQAAPLGLPRPDSSFRPRRTTIRSVRPTPSLGMPTLLSFMPHMHHARQEFPVRGDLSPTAAKRCCSPCPPTTSAGRPLTTWRNRWRCPRAPESIAWPTTTTRRATRQS